MEADIAGRKGFGLQLRIFDLGVLRNPAIPKPASALRLRSFHLIRIEGSAAKGFCMWGFPKARGTFWGSQ